MDQRNLVLAIVLSLAIMVSFEYFYANPQREAALQRAEQQVEQQAEQVERPGEPASIPTPGVGESAPGAPAEAEPTSLSREVALEAGERVRIDSPTLRGWRAHRFQVSNSAAPSRHEAQ